MDNSDIKPHKLSPKVWFPTIAAGVFALLMVFYVDHLEREQHTQQLRRETLEHLSSLHSSIENQIHNQVYLFEGLVAQIALNPTITDEEISKIVALMMDRQPLLRSFGLSREYIVSTVYPLAGNEAAIGLNYLDEPAQLIGIQKAIKTRETVIVGPINIVQGGTALIARMPIFTKVPYNKQPAGSFWGIASVLINMEQLFENISEEIVDTPLQIAIRKNTTNPSIKNVFYGSPTLFTDPLASRLTIALPTGSWELAGKGTDHLMHKLHDHRRLTILLGAISAFMVTLITFVFTRQYLQQKRIIEVQNLSREQVWHAATHDRLTGMANRHLFNEELEQLFALAERERQQLAVFFLDLDRFKEINDSFGHHVGDQFLKQFAHRLRNEVRKSELLARLGGDEFAIVSLNLSQDCIADLAHRISQSLNTPITVDHHSLNAGVSIGISLFPDDGDTPETLMHHADLAMYEAKKNPWSSYSFFIEEMNKAASERKKLVDNIRSALANNEFYLTYQPIINIQTNEFVGMETLTRWEHPTLGHISPAQFIPAAESSGLILPLGEWVLETALNEMEALLTTYPETILSINLSPIQLYRSNPVEKITKVLRDTEIVPRQLDIEITESTILEDVDIATSVIHKMRKLGISVSIDDFGTGYSSLSHLQQLPVSRIKIDLSFVRNIGFDANSEAIIKAIFFMSELMSVRVTAEGVETEEQLNFLKELGCEEVQGYYFSKPIRANELKTFIENKNVSISVSHEE